MSTDAESVTPIPGETALCPVSECHLPVDVILVSCDGTELGAHRVNLADFSQGFAKYLLPENGAAETHAVKRVELPETARTLTWLLQFMHNAPESPPDLACLTAGNLARVAEAVEKYDISSALPICMAAMTRRMHWYPITVLSYAVKHGHTSLADRAAKRALEKNYSTEGFILQAYADHMPAQDIIKWIRYQSRYVNAADAAFRYSCGVQAYTCKIECSNWGAFQAKVLHRVSHSPLVVMEFGEMVASLQPPWICVMCTSFIEDWIKCVEDERPSYEALRSKTSF